MCAGIASAQIPNSGFEQHNTDGSIRYWGKLYLFDISIDSTGQHGDSLEIDQALFAPTTDAHSGQYAAELRNGFNHTTQMQIAGEIQASNDTSFSSWNTLVNVTGSEKPNYFSFYYKYLPAGEDWAWARIALYDANSNQLGEANIITNEAATEYTYIYAPINYWMEGEPAYYTMSFSTAAPCGQATLGTRFLVDDVSFVLGNADISEEKQKPYSVFPNPTSGIFTIECNEKTQSYIYNSAGQLLFGINGASVDLSGYPSGVYYVQIKSPKKESQVVRVVKK